MPVRSRVSWGAIMAGAFIAMATYLLLGTLGLALGITVAPNTDAETLGTGAGIWAAVTMLISLFIGGCVSSRCTAGETKAEAMMYGVVVWGVFLFAMMIFATGVAGLGIGAVVGLANSPAVNQLSDQQLRDAGFSQAQIGERRAEFDKLRTNLANPSGSLRQVADDPRTTAAAWWTFGGLILSIGAAVGGAVVGSGPEFMRGFMRVQTTTGVMQEAPRGAAPR
jgi:hypothetical protein